MKTQYVTAYRQRMFRRGMALIEARFSVIFLSKFFYLLFFTCLSSALYGQAPVKKWDKTLGGNAEDHLSKSIPTSDGGYLLAGTSASDMSGDKTQASRGGRDFWMVKTDSEGNKLWDRRFGTASDDYLQAVIQTPDRGYLLGGYSDSGINGDRSQDSRGGSDYWIVKVDSNGVKQWDQRFGGNDSDALFALLNTPDGGYLLGGLSKSEANGDKTDNSLVGEDDVFRNRNDFWLIKIASNGTKQWDNTVGVYEEESGLGSLLPTTDGGYLIGGTRFWLNSNGDKDDLSSYEIVKVNSLGEQQWIRFFGGGGEDVLRTVLQTTDGGYLLGGSSTSATSPTKTQPSIGTEGDYNLADYWVIKVDGIGTKEWDRIYGTAGDDQLTSLLATPDGRYVLAGYTDGGLEYDKTEASQGGNDYWLVKIQANGTKQWDKRFGGSDNDLLASLLLTPANGLLLAGTSASGFSGDKSQASKGGSDFWVVTTVANEPPIVCFATGSILREVWTGVAGTAVSSIPLDKTPNASNQLTVFEGPSNVGDHYGARIRGYLCPPVSTSYTFYIAADDNAELWLSTNDNAAHKMKMAHITGAGAFTKPRDFTKYASQRSARIGLQAGKKYYIEVLQKEGAGNDHVAVGWQQPGDTTITVIPGSNLSPVVVPTIAITAPGDGASFLPDSPITLAAKTADADGMIKKVAFFSYATKIAEDTTLPYQLVWTPPTIGTYQLTAKATDNTGITGGSLPITIFVSETAAGRKQWDKTLGGSDDDKLAKIIPTTDGGYLLAGESSSPKSGDKSQANRVGRLPWYTDYWIVKVDASGNKQWDKTLGGIDEDKLYAVVQTPDGGYLLGGISSSTKGWEKTDAPLGEGDYWLVKVDKLGKKQWDKTYGGSDVDVLNEILPTSDGGFLLAGTSSSGISADKTQESRGYSDYWLVKVNSEGIRQWDKTLGGSSQDNLAAVVATSDGGFLLGGTSFSNQSGDKSENNRGTVNYWLVKVKHNGEKQWDKTYGGTSADYLSALIKTSDGGYLLGGSSKSGKGGDKSEDNHGGGNSSHTDIWVVKIGHTGQKQWDRTLGGAPDYLVSTGNDVLASMIETEDGNFVLAGHSESDISGDRTESSRGRSDYWMLKLDSEGSKRWDRAFGGTNYDFLAAAVQAADGGFVLGGRSSSAKGREKSEESRGFYDYWIVKTYPEETPVACVGTGRILRETWVQVPGYGVQAIPVNTSPTATRQLTRFEGPSNVTNNYGDRISGYICPPTSGYYTFWLASDDGGALYLSPDDQRANKQRIASVNGATNPREWTKFASQQSVSVYLQAGKQYYIESLHKEAYGNDHVAVGWQLPDGTLERPIPGKRLSPFVAPAGRIVDAEQEEQSLASVTGLSAAPNPFSEQTTMHFVAQASGKASVAVYDLNGSLVKVLFDHEMSAGETKELTLEGITLPSGIYLVKASSQAGVSHLKLVLAK